MKVKQTNKKRKMKRYHLQLSIILVIVLGSAGYAGLLYRKTLNFSKAATLYTTPANIAADCSVDVTGSLQTWINGVPDGSALQFGANACYRIDGTLSISGRNNLIFDGNGATFKAVTIGTRNRSQWSVKNGSNITLRNMIVRGANPNAGTGESAYVSSLEAQHAYEFLGLNGGLLENCEGYDTYGDFVYFGDGAGGLARNITVQNCHFDRNGRQGMSWTGAQDITVKNNYIYNVRRSVFDIEPNTSHDIIRRVTIANNSVGPHRLNFFANAGAGGTITDVTISGNQVQGDTLNSTMEAPGTSRRARYKILNNTATSTYGNPGGYVMKAVQIDDIEVSGNIQPGQSGRNMYVIMIRNTTGAKVTNNKIVNGVGAMKLDTGNTGYCEEGNYIGNPLKLMGPTFPCAVTPPVGSGSSGGSSGGSGGSAMPPAGTGETTGATDSGNQSSGDNITPIQSSAPATSVEESDKTPPPSVAEKAADVAQETISAPFNAVDKVVGAVFGNEKDPSTGKPKSFLQQSAPRKVAVAGGTSVGLAGAVFAGWHWGWTALLGFVRKKHYLHEAGVGHLVSFAGHGLIKPGPKV